MNTEKFYAQSQPGKLFSDAEVGHRKVAGTEDAQEIGSRPSQQTLSASFSLDGTPEGPEGLEYGTDANASATALSVRPVAFSEVLPGYDPVDLEDLELRKHAKVLNPPTAEVVLTEKDHPALGSVCEVCGSGMKLLSSCGVVLCIPCWHKGALRSFDEIYPVVDRAARGKHSLHGIRFVDLTVRHRMGESLKSVHSRLMSGWNRLRRTRFWKGHVDGCILKREVTYGKNGWHPHLHLLTVGRYIPATKSKARKGEENLSDVWRAITGDSTIVYVVAPRRTGHRGRELVGELAKYVAKPTSADEDGTTVRIDGWPKETRLELAEFLAGGLRVRWYCQAHRTRERSDCLKFEPRPGWKLARPCTGKYRKERTGFRRLIWYGSLKRTRDELNSTRPPSALGAICRKCEIGQMRTEYWWAEREWGNNIHPNADLALQYIQAHKSTDYDSLMEYFKDQNKEGPPRGWVPNYENAVRPPLRGVQNDEIAYHILGCLRSGTTAWYVIQDSFGDDFAKAGFAAKCRLEEAGYIEEIASRRYEPEYQLTGKGKWRMHCWHATEEGALQEDAPREDPGEDPGSSAETPGAICDSEDRVDRWRSSSPFSGGLE